MTEQTMAEPAVVAVGSLPTLALVINADWYFRLHWLERVRALRDKGYRVVVVTSMSDGGCAAELAEENIECRHVGFSRRGLAISAELATIRELYRAIREIRPDIVLGVTVKPNIYGGFVARTLGIPAACTVTGLGTVFSSRGLSNALLRAMILKAYRWAFRGTRNKLLFENNDDLRVFVGKGVIDESQAVKLPGAGVDTTAFRPGGSPAARPFTILFAARLLKEKGLHVLVDAIGRLRDEGQEALGLVAGIFDEDSNDAVSERELLEWQRSGLIKWLGRRDDMPDVIAGAHVVCLPTTYGEGIPRILIEAAACAKPIVASNVPGCNEIVEDGVNGLLFPAGDGAALAARLSLLAADEELRQRMGEAGRRKVVSGYSQAHVVEAMHSVYESLAVR